MQVEIKRLTPVPASADGKPYRATIITRDDAGKLVGVRVLRAREAGDLEVQIAKTRGAK